MIVLDGTSLTCAAVAVLARRQDRPEVSETGLRRARASAETARALAAQAAAEGRPVYGLTTGVGFNRRLSVSPEDERAAGLRLVRSHAAGAGPSLAPEIGLGMLAVRANQILAGGSGVTAGVVSVLADCVSDGCCPPAYRYGAIGTADLTALASAALCLLGERDWIAASQPEMATARQPRFALDPGDLLAFMSSNAATLAEAAIACDDLGRLLRASTVVAALSHLAARASAEPYAEAVQQARPHPGQQEVARELRDLLSGEPAPVARVQDPYGYRALPQVQGNAVDAVRSATAVVTTELNSAAENPLIDVAGERIWHNGNFHTAYLSHALDAARSAVFQAASLSVARLGSLLDERTTGVTTFLASETAPSSGLMMAEYAAHSAVADIRRLAAPVVLGGAVLSVGAEEHAGFGTQAAWSATQTVEPYRVVLACELVAAVRALRQRGDRTATAASGRLATAFEAAAAVLPASMADRPLEEDLRLATGLLDALAG